MLRWALAIFALLVSGAVLGGCGGGHAASTSAPTTAEAPPAGGRARPAAGRGKAKAKAQAVAFARAVNLGAADVPGFAVSPGNRRRRETTREKLLARELRRCAGSGRQASALLEASSSEFERKGGLATQSVSSQVAVDASPAIAAKELATIRSGRLRSCLSHYFTELLLGLKTRGTSISDVSTRYGSPPAPGATGSFGLRVTAKLSFENFQIPVYLDYLAFVTGSADVSLRSLGTPVPFPANTEERLFSLLLERANAHSA